MKTVSLQSRQPARTVRRASPMAEPAAPLRELSRNVGQLLPGLVVVLGLAVGARGVGSVTPDVLSEITIALGAGLVIGNVVRLHARFRRGMRFAVRSFLRAGIVLLGAGLSFGAVLAVGLNALLIIVLSMAFALSLTILLGRRFGVPTRLTILIGVGTAVCGNSAIVATAPVLGAEDREVSFAIGTITLFGLAAVLLYPLVGRVLGLSDDAFGQWAGVAVNDTSQVTAAGFAFSETAGATATVVKLTRNALMAPLIIAIATWYSRSVHEQRALAGNPAARLRLLDAVPLFVVGFLAMAAANSMGAVPAVAGPILNDAARFLILMALAGVGLSTDVRQMRAVGLRPLYVGFVVATALALFSLTLIALI